MVDGDTPATVDFREGNMNDSGDLRYEYTVEPSNDDDIDDDGVLYGEPEFASSKKEYSFTDLGWAERFADYARGKALHVSGWGWMVYDGKKWRVDIGDKMCRNQAAYLARRTAQNLLDESFLALKRGEITDEALSKVRRALRGAESVKSVSNMLKHAEHLLPADADEFDHDPMLFNAANGTVDLRTGELREHSPDDMITKCSSVAYKPDATCPTWDRFLEDIIPDKEIRDFVQTALGYSLTADTREQLMFFAHGTGANGKSTLLDAMVRILGDYAVSVQGDLLVSRIETSNTLSGIARLHGARLALVSETDEDAYFEEAKIKALTGDELVNAKRLYQDVFSFRPSHKIWFATNHKPRVKGIDHGFWRRMALIPFEVTINEEQRDKELPHKLREEDEGILAWAIRGAKKWFADGLRLPNAMVTARNEYRTDQDLIGQWIEQNTISDIRLSASASDLYQDYSQWCQEQGLRAVSQKKLGDRLKEKGYFQTRTKTSRQWSGIGLVSKNPGYADAEKNEFFLG